MVRFFIDKMEKKYRQEMLRGKIGLFSGIFGLLTNLMLFISKLLIGLSANSVSIMADAMNSFSDSISSVLVLVGFKVASKPADKDHPYGHERFEYVTGLGVALLITFVGSQFFKTSIEKMINPTSVHFSWLSFIILILSVIVKLYQGLSYRYAGTKIDSQTLIANAKDSFNDVYTTSAVLLSILVEQLTGWRIDGYIGFVLAVYITASGLLMVRDFVNELLGQRPTEKEIHQIEQQLNRYPNILGYHDLLIHNYGPQKSFASVHIEVNSQMTLDQAHDVIDLIERDIYKQLGVHLVCHLDPVTVNSEEYLEMHQELVKILNKLNSDFRMHDFRIRYNRVLEFDLVIPDSNKWSEDEIKTEIARELREIEKSYQLKIIFDHNYLL
ncbi:cation diffusion facilitator family transporter [Enterococcus alcedinis]|uniref:Cation transporter n=1 Tax=Enterococcus alcedinis TaxID=1274384 RepID=A0A917JDU9_9ENTE|nr:cation diffusion facilitator family transporter [Enterococcus alcedinis]MBP2100863.1 cation diffusion facilitator family transporter [Enterococcus alcedinis]GGI64839.1 cation transporter [Enterococcus alcedinis]